jgi:hypothetical protein
MSIDSPQEFVKGILTGVTATLDNGVTHASIVVLFEDGPENLRRLFYVNQYHAVISVGRQTERESGETRRIQDVPLRYSSDIPVKVVAVDRAGVTAAKLLNKIRLDIIAEVESHAKGIRGTLTVQSGRGGSQIIGGFDPLFQDEYILSLRPLEGEG